jgi:hypothetical protein
VLSAAQGWNAVQVPSGSGVIALVLLDSSFHCRRDWDESIMNVVPPPNMRLGYAARAVNRQVTKARQGISASVRPAAASPRKWSSMLVSG